MLHEFLAKYLTSVALVTLNLLTVFGYMYLDLMVWEATGVTILFDASLPLAARLILCLVVSVLTLNFVMCRVAGRWWSSSLRRMGL